MNPTSMKHTDAVNNPGKEWLPRAEARKEELDTKVKDVANDRARRILQQQADELEAQIETAGMITANCRWCGEVMQNADAITLHKMVKTHEASCPERPEEQEQKAEVS